MSFAELAPILLTGLFTLGGVIVGTIMSRKTEEKQNRRREIVESYANFFHSYTSFTADQSLQNKGKVIASIEIARLIMPKEIVDLFKEFEQNFLHDSNNMASRAKLLDQLRAFAYNHVSSL